MNHNYCYFRKSTDKQDFDRQLYYFEKNNFINGINCLYYFETYTGRSKKRPVLNEILKEIKKDDTLIIADVSRLSRYMIYDALTLIYGLLKKGVIIQILNLELTLTSDNLDLSKKILLESQCFIASIEVNQTSDRTKNKLQFVAKTKKLGRPTNYTINDFINTLELNANGLSVNESVKITKYPKSTFIKNLSMLRLKYNIQDKKKLVKTLKEAYYE